MVALALQTSAFIDIVSIFPNTSQGEVHFGPVPVAVAGQLCRIHLAGTSTPPANKIPLSWLTFQDPDFQLL